MCVIILNIEEKKNSNQYFFFVYQHCYQYSSPVVSHILQALTTYGESYFSSIYIEKKEIKERTISFKTPYLTHFSFLLFDTNIIRFTEIDIIKYISNHHLKPSSGAYTENLLSLQFRTTLTGLPDFQFLA